MEKSRYPYSKKVEQCYITHCYNKIKTACAKKLCKKCCIEICVNKSKFINIKCDINGCYEDVISIYEIKNITKDGGNHQFQLNRCWKHIINFVSIAKIVELSK